MEARPSLEPWSPLRHASPLVAGGAAAAPEAAAGCLVGGCAVVGPPIAIPSLVGPVLAPPGGCYILDEPLVDYEVGACFTLSS